MLGKFLGVKILMCGSTDVIIFVLFIDNIVESFCLLEDSKTQAQERQYQKLCLTSLHRVDNLIHHKMILNLFP